MSTSDLVAPADEPTALDIAAAVRSGERTARSVVEAHLARVESIDGDLHAFNLVTAEQALAEADALDARVAAGDEVGPLAGVPVALKDNLCTRGVATTCSSKILEGWRPPYDATVVQRLVHAGAIGVGKANLDEFAMGSSTENSGFGPTKNPHDLTKVPGGSSGGSTVAVASGMAAVALGSDTGGSIRQPAALCGVVGLKPTYGRVSRYGLVAFASSLDQVGPLTRTVRDAAAVYDVISGHDPLDSTSIPEVAPLAAEALDHGVDGLRVGIVSELTGEGVSADVQARVREAADALSAAGAKVDEASVPAVTYGVTAYSLIAPAEASSNLARYDGVRYGLRVPADTTPEMNLQTRTAGFGDEVKRRILIGTYALSAGYYDAFYGKAQRVRTLMIRDFAAAYEQFDLLLSPTAPTTAFDLGAKTSDPLAMYLSDTCTIPANLTGTPAISVPYGTGDDGLPVGVQLMAPALEEQRLFAAAATLEGSRS